VITRGQSTAAARYNLIRMIRLIAVLIIMLVGTSLLFENWYTAAVSLGLISLLAGFALQTPITSLIGWLYIVIRTPYHVGERIQIDTFKGDVVEISYLDTTLWEFGGDYLTNDLPSGRLVRFPNSMVLQSAVFNYSWSKFPYMWNEIPFHFAYESDLAFIEKVMKEVTRRELDQSADDQISNLKDYMKHTPISEVDIKEYPFVAFRTHINTWVEANITYLVHPKKAADTRSRIIKKVVSELLKNPEKAMFPKSNAR
jgi:small-conductance mechanosensitive channel